MLAGAHTKHFALAKGLDGIGGDEMHVDRVSDDIKHFHDIATGTIHGFQLFDELYDIAFAQPILGQVRALAASV